MAAERADAIAELKDRVESLEADLAAVRAHNRESEALIADKSAALSTLGAKLADMARDHFAGYKRMTSTTPVVLEAVRMDRQGPVHPAGPSEEELKVKISKGMGHNLGPLILFLPGNIFWSAWRRSQNVPSPSPPLPRRCRSLCRRWTRWQPCGSG